MILSQVARKEADARALELERAIDELGHALLEGPKRIEQTIERIKTQANVMIHSIDRRPIVNAMAIFMLGMALGATIARRAPEKYASQKRIAS